VSKARLVITAVVLEGRSQAEVARAYGVSKGWVSKLVARYRTQREAAFEPWSRRPKTSPRALPASTVERIVELRGELVAAGLDAGPATIAWHLDHRHDLRVGTTTIHRYLQRAGLVSAQPQKRPRSSYIRFAAELPNECWQADVTHTRLADGTEVEILCWVDDHSRYALSVTAHHRVSGPNVVDAFRRACATHGVPASTLTDNGMIFTTRLSGGKGGRNGFEAELRSLGVTQKNSRPNHPTTCGKVERFHQTLKLWLAARPPATAVIELQALLDDFVELYNQTRPHRSLAGRAVPAAAYQARPKATAGQRDGDIHWRIRHDIVDKTGRVTLRHQGRLHHIGLGYEHARTRVLILIADFDVRIINAATGELLRHLTLNPDRDYQPLGRRPGRPPRQRQQPEPK
jgi:transposase InsO family protein